MATDRAQQPGTKFASLCGCLAHFVPLRSACACDEGFTGSYCTECTLNRWGPSCLRKSHDLFVLHSCVTCAACPGGVATPCNEHGTCDQTIAGTGACACQLPYWGDGCLCEWCFWAQQMSDAVCCCMCAAPGITRLDPNNGPRQGGGIIVISVWHRFVMTVGAWLTIYLCRVCRLARASAG